MKSKFKVAVFGDFMDDIYYVGEATRLSPEAPIPVVKIEKVLMFPGGAGNVSENLHRLGCQTINFDGSDLKKPLKSRLMVGDQQMARWDFNDTCGALKNLNVVADLDAVVVADYGKGGIDESTVDFIKYTYARKVPVFVDTKRDPTVWSTIATAVFPNLKEYTEFSGGYYTLGATWDTLVCLKQGDQGLALYQDTYLVASSPARARFVRSVNGAGDTVMAAFVYMYLHIKQALYPGTEFTVNEWEGILGFANTAAAIAVEHPYTFAPSLEEINERYYATK